MTAAAPLVVVVAFRADDHLEACLDRLGGELDVLVVDNDDAGSTRELCRARSVAYLALPANVGFATAVNTGLARAEGRDVLLLNPDARIDAVAVRELAAALHHPGTRRAAVGPLLVDDAGRPEPASWPVPSPRQVWADALALRTGGGLRFVTGAVLLLRAEAIAELGGLDERYFLYAEEADWQVRAQRAGWQVAVVETVTAVHVGGASSADREGREAYFRTSAQMFVRRWHGPVGAGVIRAGSLVAAARRVVTGPAGLRGDHRRALRRTLGPARTGAPHRPAVVHAVRSDSFAGVERSVADVAGAQHAAGWRVTVVGGDPVRMRRALPVGVATLPGASTVQAWRSLRHAGPADVVHAHMTAAETAAVLAKRRLRARLVVTRHFAARRGTSVPARLAGLLVARGIDDEIAISEFVAGAVGGSTTVVPNGVRASVREMPRTPSVVVLQRLETEKQTDVAVRAWALSALPAAGWRLVVHGRGSQDAALRALAAELGCADTVDLAGFTDDPRSVLAGAGLLFAPAPTEPFGLTVAEAMAEATPVLAADGGAHRELLGEQGRYFPPGDAVAAAAALDALAGLATEERGSIGTALRTRQRERFTLERQAAALLARYRPAAPRVALLSLEPWDEVWRRNQHLASRVVARGEVASLVFVNPPRGGFALHATRATVSAGLTVVTPPLVVPRRAGGHRVLGRWLRRELAGVDVVWVNDPVAGASVVRGDRAAVYDITDDWRALDQSAADRGRIVAAEDALARRALSVVCSTALADRWRDRYGVEATLIGNGVDLAALRSARPAVLDGPAPHLVYVGTLHPNRVDSALVVRLATDGPGTLHLVGPDSLEPAVRDALLAGGAELHGPVPQAEVPSWLAAADVLVCPHLVDDFTRSLDAIKAYEYLATGAPVVATPSSGFESLSAPGLTVVPAAGFVAAVAAAVGSGPFHRTPPPDWDDRAAQFGAVLRAADPGRPG